jgi:hypothetical protein
MGWVVSALDMRICWCFLRLIQKKIRIVPDVLDLKAKATEWLVESRVPEWLTIRLKPAI